MLIVLLHEKLDFWLFLMVKGERNPLGEPSMLHHEYLLPFRGKISITMSCMPSKFGDKNVTLPLKPIIACFIPYMQTKYVNRVYKHARWCLYGFLRSLIAKIIVAQVLSSIKRSYYSWPLTHIWSFQLFVYLLIFGNCTQNMFCTIVLAIRGLLRPSKNSIFISYIIIINFFRWGFQFSFISQHSIFDCGF